MVFFFFAVLSFLWPNGPMVQWFSSHMLDLGDFFGQMLVNPPAPWHHGLHIPMKIPMKIPQILGFNHQDGPGWYVFSITSPFYGDAWLMYQGFDPSRAHKWPEKTIYIPIQKDVKKHTFCMGSMRIPGYWGYIFLCKAIFLKVYPLKIRPEYLVGWWSVTRDASTWEVGHRWPPRTWWSQGFPHQALQLVMTGHDVDSFNGIPFKKLWLYDG